MTLKIKKRILKWTAGILLAVVGLFGAVVAVVHHKQDDIVQELVSKANEDFVGRVALSGSHVSFIEDFPYIDIDLEHLLIYETKNDSAAPIVQLNELFVGFDLWTILSGKMEVKKIHLKNGRMDVVQYPDGSFNVSRAFENIKPIASAEEEFHLDLQSIELENIDLSKVNVESQMLIDVFFTKAVTSLRNTPDHLFNSLDAHFEISLVLEGDTTFLKHKHLHLDTELDYTYATQTLSLKPTTAQLEGAYFDTEGSIYFSKDAYLDLYFGGNKPNFDLFMAMAPPELMPLLKKYDNSGKIFFQTDIVGSCMNGLVPAINARFGCQEAYLHNTEVNKKLDELNFFGYFTNGESRNTSTMEFGITDFSARPEAGLFTGNLIVKNFDSPDINLQLKSDFELNFLAKFFNLTDLYDLAGKVELTMNFKDIIDFEHPERSIEKLNESYFTQLKVENLSFGKQSTELPIKDVDIYAEMNGHEAHISYCNAVVGGSDISISGSVDDLPAIIHHTDLPVTAKLNVSSKYLNLFELTGSDSLTSFDEEIKDLNIGIHFNSTARAFTESPHLPIGEFFIDNLYAKLTHYPHTLHDFHADIHVGNEDFRVVDFKGLVDKSDFNFTGKLRHYDLWFAEHPAGDTHVEFDLYSNMLQLEDLFSYRGENYVPEDYRHEEFDKLHIIGSTDLHFNEGFKSMDLQLKKFDTKMKLHAMRFENFKGRIHYEPDHLVVEDFSGKLGHSDIHTTLHYYLGNDAEQKKRENKFELTSERLDFDQLFQYHLPPAKEEAAPANSTQESTAYHDEGFNIYNLPFSDMTFDVKIGHLNYHNYLIHDIDAALRITPNHYIYLDKLLLTAADGRFSIGGYFNGSNPDKIYFSPDMSVTEVDLDKLFLKFDNFGQDHLVSENLHGKLSGKITGQVRMHKDLTPIIDESEIHLDVAVHDGRLEHFAMLDVMSDYFKDKNLKIVSFDTLANHIDINKGILSMPSMTINSSLGYMEISGSQDMDMNMDYYIKVPWRMVTEAASSKLFGKKSDEVDPQQIDAIEYADADRKTRYLNIRIKGNTEDYKITMEKNKKTKKTKEP
jgi:uncharacterized protein involved in outer membrane biogenesis